MRPVEVGLLLCSQFVEGEDPVAGFAEQLERVRYARDSGFGAVFASQHYLAHPFQYLHPLPVLSRIAGETGRMRLGTAITLLALPSPVDLAEQLATLDMITGGRLTVGIGLGYRDVEFDAFGVPRGQRLHRFLGNLDLIQAMWAQHEVSISADHVSLNQVPVTLRPVQRPYPPFWLAGHSDKAIRRAARMGLPWFAAAAHVDRDYLSHQVSVWRKACREFGREGLDLPVLQEIYVARTQDEAVETVRGSLSLKYRAYRTWGQDRVLPDHQSFDKEFDTLRQGRFILGSPSQCVDQILALLTTTDATHLVLRMRWPAMTHAETMNSMRLFADKVLPHIPTVRPWEHHVQQ